MNNDSLQTSLNHNGLLLETYNTSEHTSSMTSKANFCNVYFYFFKNFNWISFICFFSRIHWIMFFFFLWAASERSKVGFSHYFSLNAVNVTFHVSTHTALTNKYRNRCWHGFTVLVHFPLKYIQLSFDKVWWKNKRPCDSPGKKPYEMSLK